ncbi:DinB family protein [Gorillibacterium sp. CAU 1737]|uniref:DinB family protein n=1 Tax=Gorillibacterium sp. CAU 1737 TaxID=3140362 RepID=UPI003260D2FC
MNQEQWLGQIRLVRRITLQAMEGVTEVAADIQPAGFPNTLRWHFGHILTVQETVFTHFAGEASKLSSKIFTLFSNGTVPKEWSFPPPSLLELRQLLEAQLSYIESAYAHRMDETAIKPFRRLGHTMYTLGELLLFSLHHEGIHLGYINSLKKAIALSGIDDPGQTLSH